jgi:hypothetical protein
MICDVPIRQFFAGNLLSVVLLLIHLLLQEEKASDQKGILKIRRWVKQLLIATFPLTIPDEPLLIDK